MSEEDLVLGAIEGLHLRVGERRSALRAEGDDDAIGRSRIVLRQLVRLYPELQRKPIRELGREVRLRLSAFKWRVRARRGQRGVEHNAQMVPKMALRTPAPSA